MSKVDAWLLKSEARGPASTPDVVRQPDFIADFSRLEFPWVIARYPNNLDNEKGYCYRCGYIYCHRLNVDLLCFI
jgi:hypothetical protein